MMKVIFTLAKQGLLKGAKTSKLQSCDYCVIEKQTIIKFGIVVHQIKVLLDYVHMDTW